MNFERLKMRYKYLINIEEISGNIAEVCSIYYRIVDAIAVIKEFSLTIVLSSDDNMKQEIREMLITLYEKRDKLEELLYEIKLSVKFN